MDDCIVLVGKLVKRKAVVGVKQLLVALLLQG